ncbi:hypothetical protein R1sor_023271 [Riccia sorocarpa]|uniref:Reverse transcriptase domain-containing protein n=1 Tax=Riccia sorocarpa TaxID=122646 RepID=A0ABD3GQE0_9MARC
MLRRPLGNPPARPEVQQQLRDTWKTTAQDEEDARVRWELKWSATRRFLRARQNEDRKKQKEGHEKIQQLQEKLRHAARERSSAPAEDLVTLETEVKNLEAARAEQGRRWSKLRWIHDGDAPSRFFFALLKTKRAREEITALLDEHGRKLEEEDDIINELHRYYTALYKEQEVDIVSRGARSETLSKLTKKVSPSQNRKLVAWPGEEEIGRTVREFKTEKSPGADGMTAEVLQELWSHSKEDVLDFMQYFWGAEQLSWKQQSGIIKLIPKDGNRFLIKNWCPLTLLNTGYKLISKIMANRLRDVIADVVDSQQKGFIKGRRISDSVLNFLLSQEWAEKSMQPSIFVKLDFEKAYDMVDHSYLWDVMCAMGFDEKFLRLTKALVEDSTSTIHVNGRFSEPISIGRGVKQGCPLAPLLFAISTQPLMTFLREQEQQGNLTGLKLSYGRSILHNFYADDSGVMLDAAPENLRTLQETIGIYEAISGARLNLEKSTIIPVAMENIPNWLQYSGCYVAKEGEVIKYLGFPIGWKVSEAQQSNFLISKVEKRLGFWGYNLLSFEGRLIVLKHILKNVPNHLLTCMNLSSKSLQKLESSCRTFIWGRNVDGKAKIPLITWEVLHRPKGDGGLGLPSFALQSTSLRLKEFLRLFQDHDEDWEAALRAMIQLTYNRRSTTRALRDCDMREILLANPPFKIPGANITSGLIMVWYTAQKNLQISKRDLELAGNTNLEIYLLIGMKQGRLSPRDTMQIRKIIRRHKISSLGSWSDWAIEANHRRPLIQAEEVAANEGLDIYVSSKDRAKKWGKDDGICSRCNALTESPDHLFWTCRQSRSKWNDYRYATEELECFINRADNFIGAFDLAFNEMSPARYVPFLVLTKSIWLERNATVFASNRRGPPLEQLLRNARNILTAQKRMKDATSKCYQTLEDAGTSIQTALNRIQSRESDRSSTQTSILPEETDSQLQLQHDSPSDHYTRPAAPNFPPIFVYESRTSQQIDTTSPR